MNRNTTKSPRILLLISFLIVAVHVSLLGNDGDPTYQRMLEHARLADEFRNRSLFDSALFYYDSAMMLAANMEDPAQAIKWSCWRGTMLWKIDSTRLSLAVLNQARNDAYALENDTLCAIANIHLGLALSNIGLADSSLILYNLALEIYEKAGDTSGISSACSNLAILHKNRGNYDQALEYALKSYWIDKHSGEPQKRASALINLGNAYEKLKQYDTAFSCYQMSYVLCMENNLPDLAQTSLINQAVAYYGMGDIEQSRDLFLQAIDYYEKVGYNPDLSLLYSNISLVYRTLEDFDRAIYFASKSVALSDSLGYTPQKIRALNNLGICYKAAGKYPQAEASYRSSLQLAIGINQQEGIGKAYKNLANLMELTGSYEAAYRYLSLNDSMQKILYNEQKAKAIAESQTIYEVRRLKDLNQIAGLKQSQLRTERNTAYIIGVLVILILFWIAVYYIMKLRKNRIISAQRIRQLEDEKKLLAAQSVIIGQEEERKRIASELHDGIGVLLSTASIQFSGLGGKDSDEKTREKYQKAQQMLDRAGREVRRISHAMIPGVLSKFGLKEAVEDLLDEVKDTGKIDVRLDLQCPDERLPEDMEIMLYRVFQEMVNNTIKHAAAHTINCSMERSSAAIGIIYADDGKGFDLSALPRDKSQGLHGIRSRIDFLGGQVDLRSVPDEGTTYQITIPLN